MNMNNWTIARRITTGFTCLILITLILGGLSIWRVTHLRSDILDLADHSVPSLHLLGEISTISQGYQTDLLEFLNATPEKSNLLDEQIQKEAVRLGDLMQQFEKLISSEEERRLFSEVLRNHKTLNNSSSLWLAQVRESHKVQAGNDSLRSTLPKPASTNLTLGKTSNLPSDAEAETPKVSRLDALKTQFVNSVKPDSDNFLDTLEISVAFSVKSAIQDGEDGKVTAHQTIVYICFFLVIALITAVGLAWYIAKSTNLVLREIAESLDQGALQTAAAAKQVSTASQTLSSASSEQASSVEETSASLEEMTSMIRATSENAQKAKQLALESRTVADAGFSTMAEMDMTMAEMNQAMVAIDVSSAEVAKIVKDIDEIAFQTNILALNAAVEAARAGEAGAGFAVVADEVRSLAQRSAAAAKETASKIENAIASSRRGSESCLKGTGRSSKVSESLKHIAEKISSTDSLVGEIANAAREQSQGIEQINSAIAQMEKVTQSNAASAEESASASEELSAQAETLKDLIAKLRRLVGGEGITTSFQQKSHRSNSHQDGPSGFSVHSKPKTRIPMPGDQTLKSSAEDREFRNF